MTSITALKLSKDIKWRQRRQKAFFHSDIIYNLYAHRTKFFCLFISFARRLKFVLFILFIMAGMVVSRIIKGNIPVQNGIVHLIGKKACSFFHKHFTIWNTFTILSQLFLQKKPLNIWYVWESGIFLKFCLFSDKPLMVVAKTLYDYVMEEGAQQKNRLYM